MTMQELRLEELDLKAAQGACQSTVKAFKGSTNFPIRCWKSDWCPSHSPPILSAPVSRRQRLFWLQERPHDADEFGASLGRDQDQKVSE